MSPECQQSSPRPYASYLSAPNDVWSLGVILVNLTCGRNPWKRACQEDSTFRAYLADRSFLKTILPISDELNMILSRIFELDPTRRITIPELRMLISQCHRLTVQPIQHTEPAPAPVQHVVQQQHITITPPSTPPAPSPVMSPWMGPVSPIAVPSSPPHSFARSHFVADQAIPVSPVSLPPQLYPVNHHFIPQPKVIHHHHAHHYSPQYVTNAHGTPSFFTSIPAHISRMAGYLQPNFNGTVTGHCHPSNQLQVVC